MDNFWEIGKYAVNTTLVAFFGMAAYFGKSLLSRLGALEISKLEHDKMLLKTESRLNIRISIMESQVKDMQQDIKEIKDGINKLLDKLL